jgi:hypothetical protein
MLALVQGGPQQQNMMVLRQQPRVLQQQGGVGVLPPAAHIAGAAAVSGPLLHVVQYPQVVAAAASGMPQQPPACSAQGAAAAGGAGAVLVPPNSSNHNVVRLPHSRQHQQAMLPSTGGTVLRSSLSASQAMLQQQMQVLQLQHSGLSPPGVASTAMPLSHDAGHLAVASPTGVPAVVAAQQQHQQQGPGMAFVSHQLLCANRPHQHQTVMVANSAAAAAATAGMTLAGAEARGLGPTRQHKGNTPTASQQLLAMANGLQQQQQQQFDWAELAADLTGGSKAASSQAVLLGAHQLQQQQQPRDGVSVQQPPQQQLLQQHFAGEAAVGGCGGGSDRRAARPPGESWLTVVVPDLPSDVSLSEAPSCRSHSESARMAAELDELLHQVWRRRPEAT